MRMIAVLACVSSVLLVAACGPIYGTKYEFLSPRDPQGGACVAQCQQSKDNCQTSCQSDYDACLSHEDRDGRENYQRYVRERQREKKPAERSEQSFINHYHCSNSCDSRCNSYYRGCYESCGGLVIPHKACVAFCDTPPSSGDARVSATHASGSPEVP